MRLPVSFCALVLLFLSGISAPPGVPAQTPAPAGGKELVAVLDMDGVGTTQAEQSALSEELRTRLLKSGKFRIVDREKTRALLNEQAFQQQTCVSEDCAVKAGKLLGVRHLVTGRITRIEPELWQVAAQIVDVESAETLKAVTVTKRGGFERVLDESMASVADQLTAAAQRARNPNACRQDTQKLCAGVKPGEGRIAKCLVSHSAELSPACRDELESQREKGRQQGQDCRSDVLRLCKNVQPGGGRIVACLKEHLNDLSPPCRADLTGN